MEPRKQVDSLPETVSTTLENHLLGLQHVGFVVPDLEAALADLGRLYGIDAAHIRRVPEGDVEAPARFAFVTLAGAEFELIEPRSDAQKALLLAAPSGGAGINHVAWRVRDLDGALARLAERGIVPGYVTPDGPVVLPGKRMVYLDPDSTGGHFVELIEHAEDQ